MIPTTAVNRPPQIMAEQTGLMSAVPQQPVAPMSGTQPVTPVQNNTTIGSVAPNYQVTDYSGVPPTGLIGAEKALTSGYNNAMGMYDQAANDATTWLGRYRQSLPDRQLTIDDRLNSDVTGAINQGVAAFDPYMQSGGAADKLYADLTGVNGPEAQQAAHANYQSSPALQYQMDQMQRVTERSAAARGGLMGGRVMQELQRGAQGLASQDYYKNLAAVGEGASRGLSAAGQVGNLRGQQAGLAANLQSAGMQAKAQYEMQKEDIRSRLTEAQAKLQEGRALNKANLELGYSSALATGRQDAGYAMGQNAQQASQNMAKYLNDQGIAVNDMMSKDMSSITEFLYQSGMADKVDMQNLASLINNINSGQASQMFEGQQTIGAANAAGTLGVAGAINYGTDQALKNGVFSSKTTNPEDRSWWGE